MRYNIKDEYPTFFPMDPDPVQLEKNPDPAPDSTVDST